MKKKSIAFFCALTLILTGCSSNTGNRSASSSNITDSSGSETTSLPQKTSTATSDTTESSDTADTSPIQITYDTKSKTYTSDDKKTDLLYTNYASPTVKIDGNKTAASTIMSAFADEKKTFDNSISTSLEDAKSLFQENPDIFTAYGMSQSYETQRCDTQIISIQGYTSSYSDGAHGDYAYWGDNFDTKTGKKLTLDDISSDKTALLDSARNYINTQLELPFYAQGLMDSIDNSQDTINQYILTDGNWYFTNSGLTFISNIYILSSYAAGPYFFTVPYQKLEGLKADYQYTGNFELSGPVGSTLSADLNGDENIDAVYYDTTCNEDTGDLSTTLTINGKDFSSMLQNDDFSLTPGASSSYGMQYYLIDLDTSDNYIELAIQDTGLSEDYVTYFFRYDGKKLNYLGSIGDLLSNSSCNTKGDGTLTANMRVSLLETVFTTVTYQLTDDKLELVPQDWYYIKDYNSQDDSKSHKILADVTVYKEASLNSDTVTLTPSDGPVSFPALDNEHWVIVKMPDDTLYYLYMNDFSTLESGQNASDVFENLVLAD